MSRYIDAEYVKAVMINDRLMQGNAEFNLYAQQVELQVNAMPSIDIESKRGEWVKRTHNTLIAQVNFAYCSECGQPIMHEHTRSLWSFCPNCGADMKGADDERID